MEVVEIVSTHRSARVAEGGQLHPRYGRRLTRQQVALDFGGLLQLLGHDALDLLHFRQPLVLNADRGNVGHHGQQRQVFFGELAEQILRVYVDQADDLVLCLQRDSQEAEDALLNDGVALPHFGVQPRVGHQERIFVAQHPVPNRRADAEANPVGRARRQHAVLLQHQDAAPGAHRLNRQIQDHPEQLFQRTMSSQLAARIKQRLHPGCASQRRRTQRRLQPPGTLAYHSLQAGGDSRRGHDRLVQVLFKYHVGGGVAQVRIHQRQCDPAYTDSVPQTQQPPARQWLAVHAGAILAAQVFHPPLRAVRIDSDVASGQNGLVWKGQIVIGGAAQGDAAAGQGNHASIAVRQVNG